LFVYAIDRFSGWTKLAMATMDISSVTMVAVISQLEVNAPAFSSRSISSPPNALAASQLFICAFTVFGSANFALGLGYFRSSFGSSICHRSRCASRDAFDRFPRLAVSALQPPSVVSLISQA
jgi:hypothetical protein